MNADREAIARRIRALRAKTVENGCTEAEALAAAELLAGLLDRYNMTLDEAEVRESPVDHSTDSYDDPVGRQLWKVADGISYLTEARYWVSSPGVHPVEIHFFGLAHEVEVARYMLEICARAMRDAAAREGGPFLWSPRTQRRLRPFLDGMADRLRERIRALKPATPAGTGLVAVRNAVVEQAMKDRGHKLRDRNVAGSRDLERGYQAGREEGDKVSLNRGIAGQHGNLRLAS